VDASLGLKILSIVWRKEMSEVLKNAKAYLDNEHQKLREEKEVLSVGEKLIRFSDPIISAEGDLCIKMRTYARGKRIKGNFINMPGLILNLESDEDMNQVIEFIKEAMEQKEVLREVAETRKKRWEKRSGN